MITETISSLGGWNWIFAGLAMLILELIAPGVFLLWIGVAAALVGGAVLLWPDMSLLNQLALFAGVSVVSIFVAKLVFRYGTPETDETDLNRAGAGQIGRVVVVEEAIRNGRGRVRVGDSLWNAEGGNAEAGARVRVTAVRGTLLVVEPV